MTLSLQWLNDYLKTDLNPDQIAEALTSIGLEVEKIESHQSMPGGLKGVIAGKVLTCEKHPDADRLKVTTVDIGGDKPSSIVCGGPNVAAGQTVWVAIPGTTLYDKEGKPKPISVSKIRGALSEGMICAEDELGLGESHEGVLVLSDEVRIGTLASDYYNVTSDTILEIGLTPNRSDATSVLGVAEDLAAYLTLQENKELKVKWPAIPELKTPSSLQSFKVSVRNAEACPRYSGILISDIVIGTSPEWMQKHLQSIGVKSINNVVDITNFVLHEIGQPLHAFDADKISGREIIVETKNAGTPFLALDGVTYKLSEEDLMICDGEGNPMCIGGVYGGLNSGVSNTTKTIFLEAAHFNAGSVRRSSMRHNMRTEAAKRFEKGSDPNITTKALARAADLLSQFADGKVASELFDIYPKPISPVRIKLNLQKINETAGVKFTMQQIERILNVLHMEIIEKSDNSLLVTVPTNKADVLREIDVIEEILRIYGYINIPLPGKMNTSVAMESRFAFHRMRRLIGQFFSSRGFLECMNMSLTSPVYYKGLNAPDAGSWVTIHNTSNESLNLLRPEMIIQTLETIRRNVNRKQDDIRLYEFGKSYRQEEGQPSETEHLVLSLVGQQQPVHWQSKNANAVDFFSIKSEVHSLLSRLGISNWTVRKIENESGLEYGLEYATNNKPLVRFGKVASQWCDRMDIKQPVFLAEFMFETLIQKASEYTAIYSELNKFPQVQRDLAIVIDDFTSFEDIQKVALKAGGEWLTNLQVFDIYSNADQLGAGKMSVALRFTIENKDATLTDKDLDQWFGKMQRALTSGVKAEIRK
ncbi:MAG TPA: phenylalanine--tRNA ligase subunit beta [Saprospiraceae bacterium]|nr:phenylalanine--tRNA ligase subunit beta [Saprospiraceae bacterium]